MRIFLINILLICLLDACYQEDPSNWPVPSLELIESGFYTKERLIEYHKWNEEFRKQTLSPLYVLFDEQKERKLVNYQYGGGWNYEFKFEIKPNLVFYVNDRPEKNKAAQISKITQDSLGRMKYIDGDWLRDYFNQNDFGTSKCFALDMIGSEVFFLLKDPSGLNGYLVMKAEDCLEEFE